MALLHPEDDPPPVEWVNAQSRHPVLLVCEHAGRALPGALGQLGLAETALEQHIAYDIGAGGVARELADMLGCTLVLQNYSRLVIDCNRPPGVASSIPTSSDGIDIPGNAGLSETARQSRVNEIFAPWVSACHSAIAKPHIAYAFAIHSFTPKLSGQKPRPWDIGFLYRSPASQGERLAKLCQKNNPALIVAHNEPYQICEQSDWFIPACAEPRALAHALIEIRNDHIETAAGQTLWAERLRCLFMEFMDMCNV